MSKRPRYTYVTLVENTLNIYANNKTHTFKDVLDIDYKINGNELNPESLEYTLCVVTAHEDTVVVCRDELELLTILDELSEQNL